MKNKEKLKRLSKAISIIACIIKICLRVGAVCVVLAMMVIPYAFNDIKAENHTMQILGEKIEFTETVEGIEIKHGEEKEIITSEPDKEAIKTVMKYFEENNTQKLSVQIEIILLMALANIIIIDFAMKHLQKLFKNIYEKETPFDEENAPHIRQISYFFLGSLILSVAGSIISSWMFKGTITFNISIIEVVAILIGFSLSHIFEYGNALEAKKKKTSKTE